MANLRDVSIYIISTSAQLALKNQWDLQRQSNTQYMQAHTEGSHEGLKVFLVLELVFSSEAHGGKALCAPNTREGALLVSRAWFYIILPP